VFSPPLGFFSHMDPLGPPLLTRFGSDPIFFFLVFRFPFFHHSSNRPRMECMGHASFDFFLLFFPFFLRPHVFPFFHCAGDVVWYTFRDTSFSRRDFPPPPLIFSPPRSSLCLFPQMPVWWSRKWKRGSPEPFSLLLFFFPLPPQLPPPPPSSTSFF